MKSYTSLDQHVNVLSENVRSEIKRLMHTETDLQDQTKVNADVKALRVARHYQSLKI